MEKSTFFHVGDPSLVAGGSGGYMKPREMKSADNKTIATMINSTLVHPVASWAGPTQRGFITGRNLLINVLEADLHARMHAFGGLQLVGICHEAKVLFSFFEDQPLLVPPVRYSNLA